MKTSIAIGMFDGVHTGHKFLLDRLRHIAAASGTEPAVVTFDRHPLEIIRPGHSPLLLTDVDERIDLIRGAGIDRIEVVNFDEAVRSLTASDFCRTFLCPTLDPAVLLLGYDHGFGSDRLKGRQSYAEALTPLGISVEDCPPYPDGPVSSTIIRQQLAEGDVVRAAESLGRLYRIVGRVNHGKQLGRTIGFPTANIDIAPDRMIPADGVYAGIVSSGPGHVVGKSAMINIGTAPTVNGTDATKRTVEAHILDSDSDLYGKKLGIDFVKRLRDEQRFDNIDSLRSALQADMLAVRDIVASH